MNKTMRIDKFLSEMNIGSRKEIKDAVKKGRIKVNDLVIKSSDLKISPNIDRIYYDNKLVKYVEYEYFIMNKPSGVVSATKDDVDTTVIDLIKTNTREDIFPMGRLDKDTEGLLIITNDGEMAHRLLSPSNHVKKIYFARVEGKVTEEDILKFSKGLTLKDGTVTKPSNLKIILSDEVSEIELTIYEGKYHQVKRMFAAVGKKVVYLKRICMGDLYLDENLKTGEYRELTKEELKKLNS